MAFPTLILMKQVFNGNTYRSVIKNFTQIGQLEKYEKKFIYMPK